MNQRGLTLLEVFVIVIVIGVLSALVLPPVCGPGPSSRRATCANNLSQLYKLGTMYASMHKGEWPDVAGEELWLSFTQTKPPLLDPQHVSVLFCPVLGDEEGPGRTDYRGPRVPWKKLKEGEPVAADNPENHGADTGGNVLMKDGRVEEFGAKDLRWKECAEKLRP